MTDITTLMSPGALSALTWRQPVVFAAATAVCTVLAIWAVIVAPVGSVAGVSGLYFAAAIYVPLALWFGIWGCLAGYASCVFMGLYLNFSGVPGYTLPFVLVWALADFFEGFIPLLIYRSLRTKPELKLKKPKVTYTINMLLLLVLATSAFGLVYSYTAVFNIAFVLSIVLVLIQAGIEDHKTWLTWLPVGVFIASLTSGLFGVGALAVFGSIPLEAFPTVFTGWVIGDIVVLATLGTVLTVTLTPIIVKSKFYVRRFFS
ncbi:MAG: hypothetical protein NWE92_04135 [Candidatus Bathyarchaeota archaeon]|nr:hypothetical protein [Candidatus Bathyarchaeota archaeon]